MGDAAVSCSGLSKSFGRRWALVDVGFEAGWGTAVAVAGRNGSGKSTLLKLLATALRPDAGSATVAGCELRRDRDGVRRATALLGHESFLYPGLTALDNLRVVARFLGAPHGRDALLPALEAVGLAPRADDMVASFSAGMTKRLAIARLRLQPARVVLLDEPFAALDPPGFRLVEGLIDEVRAAGGCVVLATHMLGRAEATCDAALLLAGGRRAWAGAARDLAAEAEAAAAAGAA